MSVDAPLRDIPPGSGNEVPLDFSGMPTLIVNGASQVQVRKYPWYLYILLNMPYHDLHNCVVA